VLGVCLAAFVLLAMFLRSPNFDAASGVDARPYGGDFVQEYAGGWILRQGEAARLYESGYLQSVEHDPGVVGFTWNPDLWFPPVYPPFYYAAVSPLTAFEYPTALTLWLGLLVLCGLSSLVWLTARFPFWRERALWVVPAAVVFVPFTESIVSAQKGTVLLALFTTTFALSERGRPFAAGAVFGLVAFKPQLGIVLAGVAAFQRDARFLAGAAATGVALLCLSLAADPALPLEWARSIANATPQMEPELLRRSHSALGQVRLLVGAWSGPVVIGLWAVFAGAAAAALGTILRSTRARDDRPLRFTAVVLTTLLVSPHLYGYDLTLLLLPFALLIGDATDSNRKARVAWAIALFLLCGVSERIAAIVPIQSSTWAMFGLLFFLARDVRRS